MRVLVDTNLLTRAAQPKHPQYQVAVRVVSTLGSGPDVLCLAPQNLYEFWVVATRPQGENGLGMSCELAWSRLDDLKAAFEVLDETPAFRLAWESLIARHRVRGKTAHDARLVAAMAVYEITTLLTFNKQHFSRYPGITVMTPDEALNATF